MCRFFVGYGMTFSRLVPFIRFHLKKRCGWIRSNAEIKKALRPKAFKYGTSIPTDMLILTITFCYAVIAPLILVFSILYFGLGWLFMRNQVRPIRGSHRIELNKNAMNILILGCMLNATCASNLGMYTICIYWFVYLYYTSN